MSGYRYDVSQWTSMGVMPPAFDLERMPEWDVSGGMKLEDGLKEVENYVTRILKFMNDERTKLERNWRLCREYYDMDDAYKVDNNRVSSIFAQYEQRQDAELNLERAAVMHPVIFEAVQEQQSRLVGRMFNGGPRYVEVLGREQNDVPGAQVYEEVANYQQDWQIPTRDIADDVVNSGLVEGTGLVVRTWSDTMNCPKDDVPDLTDYWMDPQGANHHEDRWNAWQRYPTLGELLRLRHTGYFHFDDDDMEAVLGKGGVRKTKTDGTRKHYPGPKVSPKKQMTRVPLEQQMNRWHEIVPLTIFIQQEGVERWVYSAHDLVIGIHPNPIPKENVQEDLNLFRYPVAIFTPIRKKGSKYGDSAVYRMLDSQDIVNSISYLAMANLARSALGLWFGDPGAYQGETPKPGVINEMTDPKNNLMRVDFPDVLGTCVAATQWIKREVSDMVSGIKEPSRGEQVSANQTAFSVERMLQQTQHRMESMAVRGRRFRREYDSLGLLLNQKYLAPTTASRIAGDDGVWRPVSGNDLFGVAGKDLMPTGMPVNGSDTYLTQRALNEAAVIMQTGGDPRPLMRRYFEIEYGGSLPTTQMYPEEGVPGNDPTQENEFMAQGMPVKLMPGDDDFRHMQEHQSLYLYLMQLGADPGLIQNVLMHLLQHNSRHQQRLFESGQLAAPEMGVGTSGMNMQLPSPKPKRNGEIEKQVEAQNA